MKIKDRFNDFLSFFPPDNRDKDQELLTELRKSELPLLIYGIGDMANATHGYMQSQGITITAFFVDNEYHRSDYFNNLPCHMLENAMKQYNPCNVLIGFVNYEEGIKRMQCISAVKNVYCVANPFANTIQELNRDFLEENIQKFKEAYELFSEPFSRELFIAYIRSRLYCDSEELLPFHFKTKDANPNLDAYFNNDIINLSETESYFSGGAYRGEDVLRFVKITGGNYNQIIAAEPDSKNFSIMETNCSGIPNLELHKLALWNSATTLAFDGNKAEQSMVVEGFSKQNTVITKADTIDNIVGGGRPITLLKLNIRASEYKALEGATVTIRKYQPRIICYLSIANDSLFSIPLLIHNIDPSYQFYLRCDYPMFFQVFLYASKRRYL